MFTKYERHSLAATQSRLRGQAPTDMSGEKAAQEEAVARGELVPVYDAHGRVIAVTNVRSAS